MNKENNGKDQTVSNLQEDIHQHASHVKSVLIPNAAETPDTKPVVAETPRVKPVEEKVYRSKDPNESDQYDTKINSSHIAMLIQQQNQVIRMFTSHMQKSSLQSPVISPFNGDPLEYYTFIRAFESLVESKTTNDKDRLYDLEQYTLGEVKELVRSCHFLKPEDGYIYRSQDTYQVEKWQRV